MQDKGLTDVVLHALLVKEVPATREVLASLPNVIISCCVVQDKGLTDVVLIISCCVVQDKGLTDVMLIIFC